MSLERRRCNRDRDEREKGSGEDALHATRAAVEEGIVPGGGVALIRAQKALNNLKLEGDEKTGLEIVRRAVESPLRQLAENAGQKAHDWILGTGK